MHIESKQGVLLESLTRFYEADTNFSKFSQVIRNECGISLRILDWLVTNYSKDRNIVYVRKSAKPFNIYLEYKSQLKGYSKRYFDPFCRRERIEFRGLNTTLGQMNFFRWAIGNEVLDYCAEHNDIIETDMMDTIRARLLAGSDKPRRKELSKAAVRMCTKTEVRTTLKFE